jgi:hypothetical protein
MTFTLTTENFYLIIIAVLMLLQMYQFRILYNLRQELDDVWKQLGTLVITTSTQLTKILLEAKTKLKDEDK